MKRYAEDMQELLFTDDLVILADTAHRSEEGLHSWHTRLKRIGREKTETLMCSRQTNEKYQR